MATLVQTVLVHCGDVVHVNEHLVSREILILSTDKIVRSGYQIRRTIMGKHNGSSYLVSISMILTIFCPEV